MSVIKICGLRTVEAAVVAAEAGADYLGFIFAPSKRQVSASEVGHIIAGVRAAGFDTPTVGVFVEPDRVKLQHDIAISGIDLVQLSGDESPDDYRDVEIPLIRALAAGAQGDAAALSSRFDQWAFALHCMLDAHDPSARGGTGKLANWPLCTELAAQRKIILAGGLHPENVQEAIATVRPYGVDVASGVETDGVKDENKIRAFIANARTGFAALAS